MTTPGVQLLQSLARWCCGTVRYAVTEETLLLSDIVRRFLGNFTLGWDVLSVKKDGVIKTWTHHAGSLNI